MLRWPSRGRSEGRSFRVFSGRAERQTRSPGDDPERTPDRPRLRESHERPEDRLGSTGTSGIQSLICRTERIQIRFGAACPALDYNSLPRFLHSMTREERCESNAARPSIESLERARHQQADPDASGHGRAQARPGVHAGRPEGSTGRCAEEGRQGGYRPLQREGRGEGRHRCASSRRSPRARSSWRLRRRLLPRRRPRRKTRFSRSPTSALPPRGNCRRSRTAWPSATSR